MGIGRAVFAILLALGVTSFSSTASSQVLQGVVVDDETRTPLPAALVVLVDSIGEDRQRYLADADGGFRFLLPAPGRYGLRVERLGAETSRLDGVRLAVGDTLMVRIAMRTRPVVLEGIEVRGESRCTLAGDAGAENYEVWEAARKALASASLSDSLAVYRYDLVRYQRILDPTTLTVRETTESRESAWTRRPIVSRPMEVLADSGFVVQDSREGDRYYAPDATALLSDEFLDTHCFELRSGSGDEADLVGLEFRPLRGASEVPDIEGVLWLNREDGGLRWLEFHYTDLPGALGDLWTDDIGGRVEFRGLPDGNWIVSRWYIRMPVAEEVQQPLIGRRVRLAAIAEEGGRVVRVQRPGAPGIAFAGAAGTIVGSVLRPRTPDPRNDESVLIIGTGARSELDARRRFRIGGVPEGRYELAYVRAELMGLDESYPAAEVQVTRGDTSRLTVDPPSYEEVLAWTCGAEDWNSTEAVLLGEVVDAETGIAATDAEVRVTWRSYRSQDLERGRFRGIERSQTTRTDERGAFRVCGVPTESTLTVTALLEEGGSFERSLWIPEGQPVESVVLGESDPSPRVAARRSSDRMSDAENPSVGRFVGRVVDVESGEPLAGVAVRLHDLSRVVATGQRGRFELSTVPAGRHVVEFSSLGYATRRDTIIVEADRTSDAEVRLTVEAIDMAPIEVTVERREVALETAGFYERREEGWGRFIDLEDIELRNPSETTDLFTTMNGVTLVPDCWNPLERYVLVRGGRASGCYPSPGLCFPTVLMDGIVVHQSGTQPARIDHLINSHSMAGVEVYPSSIGVPMQYAGTGSSCGVILIWTRR